MNNMPNHSIYHILVLNKDSKFFGVFYEVADILQLNYHMVLSDNYDGMLIKRINIFLNKGLRATAHKLNYFCVAVEVILLLLYIWNLVHIPGTDLSRSLVAIGREYFLLFDFSTTKHLQLMPSPVSMIAYVRLQAKLLEAG